ncbi:hypothetical protein D3C81_1220620 [compost metagenome]
MRGIEIGIDFAQQRFDARAGIGGIRVRQQQVGAFGQARQTRHRLLRGLFDHGVQQRMAGVGQQLAQDFARTALASGRRYHVQQRPQVGAGGGRAAGQHGRRGDQLLRLDDAPVRQLDLGLAQQADRLRQAQPHALHVDVRHRLVQHVKSGQVEHGRHLVLAGCPAARQQILQAVVGHRFDKHVQQEAVGERRQALVLGQRIGGADADAQRACDTRMAAAELAFVQQSQQGIEDGRRAKEDFVEEGDFRLRQHARDIGLHLAQAQLAQVDGAEQFGRFREAAQQIFEILAAQALRHAAYHRALRRAGRPDHQQMFARHGRQDHQFGQLFAVDQAGGGLADGGA